MKKGSRKCIHCHYFKRSSGTGSIGKCTEFNLPVKDTLCGCSVSNNQIALHNFERGNKG